MASNPKHPPAPPMDLGNMRALGVQRQRSHAAIVEARQIR
jgi:hypothetical protein